MDEQARSGARSQPACLMGDRQVLRKNLRIFFALVGYSSGGKIQDKIVLICQL